jgi:acetate kinase
VTKGGRYILVINSDSSSLKFSLLDVKSEALIASGIAERLGTAEAFLKFSAKLPL